MRKYLCLLPLLLSGFAASAQGNALLTFNLRQAETLRIGMLVLGLWAILNIVVGSFKLTKTSRSKRFFHQMNIYWNIVNLCIAGASLYFLMSEDVTIRTLAESVRMHASYKKILYLAIGLDAAFIMLGSYLVERSRNSPKIEQLQGWGRSIVMQGVFLLILDVTLATLLELPSEQLFQLIR
ncbi:DUF6992 family protein [Pontibacter ruber]|uniref:DUF6992 family protein n=1 Tax=Pontibacter ruber TaxID=1343895 RepID=A0ABW5CZI9_9BACT|nr:hypothetical protein [Pontibacter ruber]